MKKAFRVCRTRTLDRELFMLVGASIFSISLVASSALAESFTCGSASSGAQERGRVRVTDSVAGVRLGMELEEVHKKLEKIGTRGQRDEREEERDEGGRKEAWTLRKTPFSAVAYQSDARGRVKWVTGFVRPGKEIPFSKLGDLAHASSKSAQGAVWNVETAEGSFRLIVKGAQSKAQVVQLLSLRSED